MDRRFSVPYFLALISAPVAAGLRLWSLSAAVDSQGLPAMHLSMWCLIGAGGLFLAAALALSLVSPGRSSLRSAIHYGRGGFMCALAAAVLVLLSAGLEFLEELSEGPKITTAPLFLLGLVGGICLVVTAFARRSPEKRLPGAELLPVAYILVKLLISFKGWSTDPIILDYCVRLFGLIFALMAFLWGSGFSLDLGKPRRAMFCAMGAVFFCAAAMMDGISSLSFGAIAGYGGFLLWQLPLLWDLCIPAAPRESSEEH